MPGSGFYLAAFWELNSDRPAGMAVAPIPFSTIDRFAARNGIEDEDFDTFTRLMRAMDEVVLAHAKSDQPAAQKPQQTGRPLSPELFDAMFG